MQTVGSSCKCCGKPITFSADAIGCPRCKVVFHRACLQDSVCLHCGVDMAKLAARELDAQQASQESLLKSGRRQMQLCMVLLGVLVLHHLLVPFVMGSSNAYRIMPWVQGLWIAGLCYWTYSGHTWARLILAIPVITTILSCLTLLQSEGATVNAATMGVTMVSLACATVIAWFLLGSRSVRYFLAAQRQPPRQ